MDVLEFRSKFRSTQLSLSQSEEKLFKEKIKMFEKENKRNHQNIWKRNGEIRRTENDYIYHISYHNW